MAYYFVANYDVTDPEMYAKYPPAVGPTLGQYGAKILVVDHEPKDIEGKSGNTLIILEFESEEACRRWYDSPEYQAVVKLRTDASEGWARGAATFVPPGS
jgi:uncharacterized protein (DUF1330 family)